MSTFTNVPPILKAALHYSPVDMWKEENNELIKSFEFTNFIEAFGFMTKVAILAEKMDHHPNWQNVYNRVDITLSTHEAGNVVTDKDHQLAKAIDELLS